MCKDSRVGEVEDGGECEIERAQAQCGDEGCVVHGFGLRRQDKGATNDRQETQYLCESANRFRRLGCQDEWV